MQTTMRAKAGMLMLAAVTLLLESGCARSINGNAGEKGVQSAPQGVSGDLSSGGRGAASERRAGRGGQDGSDPIPSLSEFQRTDPSALGRSTGEERISDEAVTISPSNSSGGRRGRFGEGLSPEERKKGERLAELAGLEDIFFGYDSSAISDEARERLLRAAGWLQGDPKHKLLIEGHCDERGTIDYNLVLGEKRARAVVNFLKDQHLEAARLTVVSYGKERPFCRNHDEPCYQQNRRGHLVVRQ